jgi:small nuclear ribonucleoprotein (snRNP)-like protein
MHTTIIKTKDGKEYSGRIHYFRPAFNFLSINIGKEIKRFSFDEIESAITLNQRVSIKSPVERENQDEMKRAKKSLDDGRKNGWTETDENGQEQPYPKEKWEWEKMYE